MPMPEPLGTGGFFKLIGDNGVDAIQAGKLAAIACPLVHPV